MSKTIKYITKVSTQFENVQQLFFKGKWVDYLFKQHYKANEFIYSARKITNKCQQLRQIGFTDTLLNETDDERYNVFLNNLLKKLKKIDIITLEMGMSNKEFVYTR